jgi:glucose/arabinose dehydrogenase
MGRFFIIFGALLMAGEAYGQSLELVPSTLVVPPQYQRYYDSVHTVYLPKGFTASVYYTGHLSSPRFMGFSASGNLCVADQSLGTIFEVIDSDGIGDSAITLATNTEKAHSLAFHNGSLFAASSNHVWKFDNPNSSGLYTTRTLFIDSLGSTAEGSTNHTTRTMLFDDASSSLFISVGSACNACRESDTERGTILRFNSDGSHRSIYATGLRNAVGLAMDSSHSLWATVAERNNQGEDVPGDLVTAIDSGRFYGWPLAFGNHQWDDFTLDSEYQALLPITREDSVNVAAMRVPDVVLPAHSTPLGIVYSEDTNLPSAYRQSFFVAVHGSYPGADGRYVANGSKIVLLSKTGTVWTSEDFCTGFLTDSIRSIRWARPAGIIMDGKGNIYFSDDNASSHAPPAIFKIHYDASDAVPLATNSSVPMHLFQEGTIVTLEFTNHKGSSPAIQLFDALGRNRSVPIHAVSAEERKLDLSSLEAGIYFVVIRWNGTEFVRTVLR